MYLRQCISCLVFLGMISSLLNAQEWSRFRGEDGAGIGEGVSIPVKFKEEHFLWRAKVPGAGSSSPVLWGQKVFLTWSEEKEKKRGLVLLNSETGKQEWIWTTEFEAYKHHRDNSYAASTPALDEKNAYISWISKDRLIVQAVSHKGESVWSQDLGVFSAKHGAGGSPIMIDGVVVVGNDNRTGQSFIVGLEAATGITLWKLKRKSQCASYITPAVYRPKGKPIEVIFCCPPHGISSLNPKDGSLNWELSDLFKYKSVASPVVTKDLIFAFAGSGGGGKEGAVVRKTKAAKIVYSINKNIPYVPTPLVLGELIFILSDSGTLTCADTATGKVFWKEKLDGRFYASLVCVNKRLYCSSRNGEVIVVQAKKKFKLLARNQINETIFSTPAIANNRLYLRTDKALICIGVPKE